MDTKSSNLEQGYQASLQDLEKGFQGAVGQAPSPLAPAKPSPLMSSPKGFYGPGVLANLESRLTGKTPEQAYAQRVPQLETAAGVLGSLMAPGQSILRQAGSQALVGGGLEALKGTGPLRALGKGLESGGAALIGGGMAQGLIGQPARQKAAALATKTFDEAVAGREAGIKSMEQAHKMTGQFNKAMTEALNTMEKGAYEAAKAEHAGQAAASIAKDLKKNVPALSPFPDTEAGLADMLYGKGKKVVNREFDRALKVVINTGKGKPVSLPIDAANELGIQGTGASALPLSRVAREALERAGKLPPMGMVTVDAGDLATAALGQWRKNPGAYKAAMSALDKANIGDPQARAAYKYYTGQLDYFNATKAMKGEKFDPAAYRAGATSKNIEILRRRGIGSLTEGPMELTKGSPLAPLPRQVPPQSPLPAPPPEVTKPDIRTLKNPLAGHPFALGGGLEALNYGLTGSHGYGVPFLTGVAAANAIPKEIVTKTPGVPSLIQLLIQAATKGGGAAGSTLGP